jgi:hypothetical protein
MMKTGPIGRYRKNYCQVTVQVAVHLTKFYLPKIKNRGPVYGTRDAYGAIKWCSRIINAANNRGLGMHPNLIIGAHIPAADGGNPLQAVVRHHPVGGRQGRRGDELSI